MKASDLRSTFPGPWTPATGPVMVTAHGSKRPQGPKSDDFKWPNTLCVHCNSTGTQAFDRAYETLAAFLKDNSERVHERGVLDFRLVYGSNYRLQVPNLLGYFMKCTGCALAAEGYPPSPDYARLMGAPDTQPFCLTIAVNETFRDELGDQVLSAFHAEVVGPGGEIAGVLNTGMFEFRTWWRVRPNPMESLRAIWFPVRRVAVPKVKHQEAVNCWSF